MTKKVFTQDVVYTLICEKPGLCGYDISKKLNMSNSRVYAVLHKLRRDGFTKSKVVKNPRRKRIYFPVNAFDMLPAELKKELRNFQ